MSPSPVDADNTIDLGWMQSCNQMGEQAEVMFYNLRRRCETRSPHHGNFHEGEPSSIPKINITGRKRGRPPKNRDNRETEHHVPIRETERKRRKIGAVSQMPRTIFSWLIDSKIVRNKETVWYTDRAVKHLLLVGTITHSGILCSCCDEVISVWEFQKHAGMGDYSKPYQNILVAETRRSLLSCQIKAWDRQATREKKGFHQIEPSEDASDEHDDACMICSDGGELLCCDLCPSTFHHTCLDMEMVPDGVWYCPYCICKFCGLYHGPKDELLSCSQCEKKYHWECSQEKETKHIDLNRLPTSFCEQSCREIFVKLENLIGVKNELDDSRELSWTLIRRINPNFGAYVHDPHQQAICNSKLAVAWSVMKEGFERSIDRQTKINVMRSTVYNCGSNYTRINFSGFYTAILERKDEIISAASLRIHGAKLAEMPLIATSESYRKQGMCGKLLTAIESILCFLKVENLVLPSIPDRITSWKSNYGFHDIEYPLKKEISYFNTLMFSGSVRLQKILLWHAPEPEIAPREMEVDEEEGNENRSCLDSENFINPKFFGSSLAEMEVNKANFSFAVREADDRIYHYQNGVDLNLSPPPNIPRHKKACRVSK